MENEEFDTEALNEGLNEETAKVDPYAEPDPENPEDESRRDPPAEPDPENPDDPDAIDDPDPRPLTRGQARMQTLANERAEEKRKREEAEQREAVLQRQIAELQRGQQRPAEDENLDPLEKWQRDANQQLQRSQFQSQDTLDQVKFLQKVGQKPSLAPFADQVEKRLHDIRSKGGFPTRDQVLTVIMGERALANMDKAPIVKREAAARVKAATGKPLGTKSNVAPSKSESSEYERLKDIQL